MSKRPVPTIAIRDLAALAFMAQRMNGNLHRDHRVFDQESQDWREVTPNKEIMRSNFELSTRPTEQDYEQADAAINAVQGDAVLRILKGQLMNDFARSLVELTKQETATERDCGLMAFLPRTYITQQAREARDLEITSFANTSEYLGRVGDKVTVDFVMIDKRFLQQYNCWSVFGRDAAGNAVGFLTQHENLACNGRIQGKIKRTEVDSYRGGAKVTGLNYVKAI
jgi:hypothetical protein